MFTFKKHIATGRYRSFMPQHVDIKIKRKKVGQIAEKSHLDKAPYNERFSIRLLLVDEKEQCGWKWATLTAKFETIELAKEFLVKHHDTIVKKFELYHMED